MANAVEESIQAMRAGFADLVNFCSTADYVAAERYWSPN